MKSIYIYVNQGRSGSRVVGMLHILSLLDDDHRWLLVLHVKTRPLIGWLRSLSKHCNTSHAIVYAACRSVSEIHSPLDYRYPIMRTFHARLHVATYYTINPCLPNSSYLHPA